MNHVFTCLAHWASRQAGRAHTFALEVAVLLAWGISGPFFGWSDTWQLVINTGTTIVTFLMVFLIQNTQNRDTQAIQLKLDELIRVNKRARNDLLNLEDLSEEELDKVKTAFARLAQKSSGRTAEELQDASEEVAAAQEALQHEKNKRKQPARSNRKDPVG